ncbi:MAG: zeta toxin family protein [Deltaproteobacteria bacterium]|jgi:predicted ABC-type ATPase|nr:zeta toxin family protein [Deltaproteobacteria bacterium]
MLDLIGHGRNKIREGNAYKLAKEVHVEIFSELLLELLINSGESKEHPRIVILGGQPGSGKSTLADIARHKVFDNQPVAAINGDDYRACHPMAGEIYKKNDKRFAELTDADGRIWTSKLLECAIQGKRDIIFEATMRNREPLMSTINHLKNEGYDIEIMVMAVPGSVSRAGIVKRYENQRARGYMARWTPFQAHDEAYVNMPETVSGIEKESPIDSICVYNRAQELLYSNMRRDGILKPALPQQDAKASIQIERSRPLSLYEQNLLNDNVKNIQKMMEDRGAGKDFNAISAVIFGNAGLERHLI